jgi:histidine triad (HIT) family protein
MSDCIFCKIIAREIPSEIIFEDEQTLAFLNIHPVMPGHALIIPKRHSEKFAVTPAEDVVAVMATAQKITPAILAAVGATDFNFSTNNGSAAGQVIFHTHFHLIPRQPKDGHEHWHGEQQPKGIPALAAKIRETLA